MKKITLLLFILWLTTISSYGQDLLSMPPHLLAPCKAPDADTVEAKTWPWYGNNDYLYRLVDSVDNIYGTGSGRTGDVERVMYRVPVKFWVYADNTGQRGANTFARLPEDQDFQRMLDFLNESFRNSNVHIRFYMSCSGIGRINDDDRIVLENNLEQFVVCQQNFEFR